MPSVRLRKDEIPYEINEELKLLRQNILFCGTDKKVILLTSAFSGEGKTTVTLNLCRSLSELGKKVLLIDTDMRKSVLRDRIAKNVPEIGLSHFLSGQCKFSEILCTTNVNGLSVIFSGKTPPNPAELLSSINMQKLIDYCRERYDYIIVDCPPLGLVVDAAIVAPHCDGSLILIESGEVKYRMAQEVIAKMKNTDCPILGVVLNKVDFKKNGYGYGYGKYYYEKKYTKYY